MEKIYLFLMGSALLFQFCRSENRDQENQKKEAIGKYELVISESNLDKYIADSNRYKHLTLALNEDMTFLFSNDVPFLFDSIGIWEVKEVGLYAYNHLIYKKNNECVDQFSPCCYNNDRIQIKMPLSKANSSQVTLLVFKKNTMICKK